MASPLPSNPSQGRAPLSSRVVGGVGVIVGTTVVLWLIEFVDTIVLDDHLQGGGIHPRRLDGLDGVLWAPILHLGFGHVLANTIPFVLLGLLVMSHGRVRWVQVCVGVALLGGVLTWVFARSGNHIGASGVVFGLLGYLVAGAFTARSVKAVWTGMIALFLYGGLLWGILPSPGISWEGHLFGLVAGAVMAFALGAPERSERPARPTAARRLGRRLGG